MFKFKVVRLSDLHTSNWKVNNALPMQFESLCLTGLAGLPGWMDVTRAPVESQAAWKPKSLLLLGFWFRLIRISQ